MPELLTGHPSGSYCVLSSPMKAAATSSSTISSSGSETSSSSSPSSSSSDSSSSSPSSTVKGDLGDSPSIEASSDSSGGGVIAGGGEGGGDGGGGDDKGIFLSPAENCGTNPSTRNRNSTSCIACCNNVVAMRPLRINDCVDLIKASLAAYAASKFALARSRG